MIGAVGTHFAAMLLSMYCFLFRKALLLAFTLVLASLVLLSLSGTLMGPGEILDALYAYEDNHDILPDWLWDNGVPGNPYSN